MRRGIDSPAELGTNEQNESAAKIAETGFFVKLSALTKDARKNPVSRYTKISETGFFAKSPTVTKDARKNPVSRHPAHPCEKNLAQTAPNR